MAETYGRKVTAVAAHHPLAVATLLLPDSAADLGAQQQAMARGKAVLAQNPDGTMSFYTFDYERWRPVNPPMLKVR